MKVINKYRSSIIIVCAILLCIIVFEKCINGTKEKTGSQLTSKFKDFAGSSSCFGCHKNISEQHLKTAHFKTSAVAVENNIMGSFDSGKNTYSYISGGMISMEKRDNGFFQVGYLNGEEKKSQRFDIVIGSGTKGQSFASWANNKLFQLPITYFTSANQWCNSPGYPNKLAFNRPVTSRCLECHATLAEKLTVEGKEPEEFNKSTMILGVDCEKCHGAAANHVEFQTQNPREKTGRFILNPANFTRQQSLDLCALCHGGRLQKIKPSFAFSAADKLSDFFMVDTVAKDANNIDVHGNQYGLLAASKCFKMSSTLTCITCHNSHENQKGQTAAFSQHCLSCHNNKKINAIVCKLTATEGESINKNCTSCHMPELLSRSIAVILQGKEMPTPASMHTHFIKNYPEETRKVLAYLKSK